MTNLKSYNKKRDFDKTTEPVGIPVKTKNQGDKSAKKFVVQHHKARADHFDFRLEYGGVLLSFAVPKGLSQNPKEKRLAIRVEDHPLDYANFEGIIPKGNYGAGTVEIFDSGKYYPVESFASGLKKGHLKFVLDGKKLKGEWVLTKTDAKNWLVIKKNDRFAKDGKGRLQADKLPFKSVCCELATLSSKIPANKDWIFEFKYDGYRIVSLVQNGKVKLLSRNQKDYTKKFEKIASSLKQLDASNFVCDGEVVAFDKDGRSDFGLLQNSIKSGDNNLCYVIFDLLALDGVDLKNLPLESRKKKLELLLFDAPQNLIYSKDVSDGKKIFEFAKKHNLEGIMAKKKSSIYEQKRTEDWLKIKCYKRQEFVIVGYTTTQKNQNLSAVLLGYYNQKKLKYVGKAGTGFDEVLRRELSKKFAKIKTQNSPLDKKSKAKNVFWLKPQYVAEIQFAEITKSGLLRQPSFVGLRQDKDAKDVTLEKEL